MSSVSCLLGDRITFLQKACSSRECTSEGLRARIDELYSTFIACPMKRSAVSLKRSNNSYFNIRAVSTWLATLRILLEINTFRWPAQR